MDKGSFVMYSDYLKQIEVMTPEQVKALMIALLRYAAGTQPDEACADLDPVASMAFSFMQSRIDKDDKAYNDRCKQNAENAKKRYKTASDEKHAIATNRSKTPATVCDGMQSDANASETCPYDNDNDIDNDSDLKEKKHILSGNPTECTQSKPNAAQRKDKYADESSIIVEYLNLKTGKKFEDKSKDTRRLISARLNEGYTVDDFKRVIDIKTAEWLGNPDMDKYLRPSTLFAAGHFEGYLNQRTKEEAQSEADKGRESIQDKYRRLYDQWSHPTGDTHGRGW